MGSWRIFWPSFKWKGEWRSRFLVKICNCKLQPNRQFYVATRRTQTNHSVFYQIILVFVIFDSESDIFVSHTYCNKVLLWVYVFCYVQIMFVGDCAGNFCRAPCCITWHITWHVDDNISGRRSTLSNLDSKSEDSRRQRQLQQWRRTLSARQRGHQISFDSCRPTLTVAWLKPVYHV